MREGEQEMRTPSLWKRQPVSGGRASRVAGVRSRDVENDRSSATREFWSEYQPGLGFGHPAVGSKAFFDNVSAHRYSLEPHIFDVVQFERWSGCDVLEAGCGIGTDGAQFAAAGARYTGLDFSPTALTLARRRFALEKLPGNFVGGSVTNLPFKDNRFDLVFSHGVIHHVADPAAAVREFERVLKPEGTVLLMVYHRRSFNYYVTIMLLRRAFLGLLLLPKAVAIASRVTGEPQEVLAGHKQLLARHGVRYLLDHDLFLSRNTDGPRNPLSKTYSRAEIRALFSPRFECVRTDLRYLNLRLYPGGTRLAGTRLAKRLERRFGWHLYVEAKKIGRAPA